VPEHKAIVKYEWHCTSGYYIFPTDYLFKIPLVQEQGFRLNTQEKGYKGDENTENLSREEIKIFQLA